MSFRARLFLAFSLAVLVPLGLLAFGVRREMGRRLTAEYTRRVRGAVSSVAADLARESRSIASRLEALGLDLGGNNRFRLATLQGDPGARRWLLDAAGEAMRLSGLSFLQVQDREGRILGSGHFRNEFDRLVPEAPRLLAAAGDQPVVVRARTAEAPLLALARVDSFFVGGARFTVAGGVTLEDQLLARLSRDPGLAVTLELPGAADSASAAGGEVVSALPVPYLDLLADTGRLDTARLVVTQSAGTLQALRRSVDRWTLIALAATAALAVAGAAWLSARVSRPLRDLAQKTAAIDLERLDQDFTTERSDEIGALSRLLGAMTERLRLGAARLREAERRAATGELARQVNHDIKNGLVPIRNVLRHLSQVAGEKPETLATVFEERRGTLESSVAYLDNLARNYARLSPVGPRTPCDVNAVAAEVVRSVVPRGGAVRASLGEGLPAVAADGVALRRIIENLVGNAMDSVSGRAAGEVTVTTEAAKTDAAGQVVRIVVADTGPGMTRAELDRAFDDFYTTKDAGTGLGLSIVRRLVVDLDGALRVATEPGMGTQVTVELPALEQGAAG